MTSEIYKRSTPRGWRTYHTDAGPQKFPVENILQKHTDEAGSGTTRWTLYINVCAGIAESTQHYKTLNEAFRAFVLAGRRKL